MEKTIIFPSSGENEILVTKVEAELTNRGLINVHDSKDVLIGHVVCHGDYWLFRAVNDSMEADSLVDIMIEYKNYTFKFVT